MEITITDKTLEFNFAADIVARRQNRALYKPFKLEGGAYAVFVKGPNQELVRVEFDKSQASADLNNIGPKYLPTFWATRLSTAAIEEPEPQALSLNDIADYHLTKKGPVDDWDGKYIADKNELFRTMPELKNAIPSYTLTIPMSKTDKSSFPDAAPNREAYDTLKKQTTPYSKNKS